MDEKTVFKPESFLKEARILFKILAMLRQNPTNRRIGREEIASEIEYSTRNTQRYLNTLREEGLLDYDSTLRSYVVTERGYAFPSPSFTLEETFALVIYAQLLGKTPPAFGADLRRAVGKISSQLPKSLRTLAQESAREIETATRPFVGGDAKLLTLLEAARTRNVVHMDYTSGGRGREWRYLHPYGFDVDGSRWWVHGWCAQNETIRTFSLESLHALDVLEQTFDRDEEAWAEFRRKPGVFRQIRGGEPVVVDAIFAPEVARYALRTPWPEGFATEQLPDGSVRLTGVAQGVEGIVPELLRWRRFVEVVGSPALREAMRAELQAMAEIYEKNSSDANGSATHGGTRSSIER